MKYDVRQNISREEIMGKKWIIVSVAILLTTTVARSDQPVSEPKHQIGVSLGGLHYQVKDNIIAPLRWDGFGAVLDLSYTIVKDVGRHKIMVRIPYASPTNRYNHQALAGAVTIGYQYLHRIHRNILGGQLHLGGSLDGSMNLQFYWDWDDSHIYWLTAYELGPTVMWNRSVGRSHLFALNFNLPLLALVSRPPEYRYYDQGKMNKFSYWFTKPHEDMGLTSVHEYVSLRLQGDYLYRVSQRLMLGVSFLMSYRSTSEPKRISIVSNTLLLRLLFTSK